MNLENHVRNIPDFPKPGIQFKDISPLLENPAAFRYTIDALAQLVQKSNADVIAGFDARGFLLAAPVAYMMQKPLTLLRKSGKLPHKTISEDYGLEYGTNTLEIHQDAIQKDQRVYLLDDLLATGGTMKAGVKLIERLEGIVAGAAVVVELTDLKGRETLAPYAIDTLLTY